MKNFIVRTDIDNFEFILNLLFQSIDIDYVLFRCDILAGDYEELANHIIKNNKSTKVAYVFTGVQAMTKTQWGLILAEIIKEKRTLIIIAKHHVDIPTVVEVRCTTVSLQNK